MLILNILFRLVEMVPECPAGEWYDETTQDCVPCKQGAFCFTCDDETACTSCFKADPDVVDLLGDDIQPDPDTGMCPEYISKQEG